MKKEENSFIETAYKYDRVKELEEAFNEYNPKEEWHEGKIENVIEESTIEYKKTYFVGDIVFVKQYVYSDGKEGKNHLFVIIDKDNIAIPIEYFGMLISSNINKVRFSTNKLLEKDTNNNLNKDSIVKTDVIYKISNEQILFKIGIVDKEKIEEYKQSFYGTL